MQRVGVRLQNTLQRPWILCEHKLFLKPLPGHERVVPALYFLRDSRTDCAKAGKKVVIIGAWKTKFNVHNSQQECMQRADVRL